MTLTHLEVLVEEGSMEEALQGLLPKIIGNVSFSIFAYPGKQALLSRLPARLRGYRHFLPTDWRILIVLDRDRDDCLVLKGQVELMVRNAGLLPRKNATENQFHVLTRIAIEELEAWYFGDWVAVRVAYPRVPERIHYRDPDAIPGGTWEAFQRIIQKAGYHSGGLRKIEAAQRIANAMEPVRNTSRSFQVLRHTLAELAGT